MATETDKKPTQEMHCNAPLAVSSLKRKRPPQIEIPRVLQEIKKFEDLTPRTEAICFGEAGVGVSAIKGKKKFMEDRHRVISSLRGNCNGGFFGVYDGHGGKKAAEFVAENLHTNILEMMVNCTGNVSKEEAVKAAYLKTDKDFLEQGVVSGACCVTALIEGQQVVISNLGDCRAVLCRGGVAEALTRDHKPEDKHERTRIEDKGGFVHFHRGAWRVHGVLAVSRSIGDAHLKDWVLGEPDTRILPLTPDMEFLVLASDGLWEEVGNQEAVDIITGFCMPDKRLGPKRGATESEDGDYGCVNVSPSSKLRRVSLVKQQKVLRHRQPADVSWKDTKDDFRCENESPPSKLRRISLVKRINMKEEESPPIQVEIGCKSRPAPSTLVAACKELVNLAVSRGIPACFSTMERQTDEVAGIVTRSGQSVFMSVYLTKLAGQCRLITITWCKNLLLHGLSVSVQATNGKELCHCKVQVKPWSFWRKQGFKQFVIDGKTVDVAWDLTAAKFNGKTEPRSDYYVAIVCDEEVVLVVGDLKKDAYRKTRCRPALIEPILVSRKEHVFGKNRFTTRVKFHEKEKFHDISLECSSTKSSSIIGGLDPQLEVKVDGQLAIQIKHLQWKFRGNESINVSDFRVEVYWDVHDWVFGSGPKHGLFLFKPVSLSSPSPSPSTSSPPSSLSTHQEVVNFASGEDDHGNGSSSFCLFLHAWKEE
ncbi:hypothetical protein Tsubulata_040754 [Turnera subulata]|uniref:protein-serine/threonine phosphatase n=1 Tax=Turnera subulata TaxID=218843 RepID=A0A9Q0F9Y9_9ROSI|nr:hypothetical protein Tsubulata_040754 [Turnera subulata]